jgi:Xaa-Pro aminopeptidase
LEKVLIHDIKFAGKPVDDKLAEIRLKMKEQKADFHMISALDDLAWTFNIRGNDVEYNPVIIGYGIISLSKAYFFVDKNKISSEIQAYFDLFEIELKDYDSIMGFVSQLQETQIMFVDPNICSQTIYESINAKILHGPSIPKLLKAIKNKIEIDHVREVMKKDGAASAETFYWLEQNLNKNQGITECEFATKLAYNRSLKENYHGESFGAIIGYKSNGAIIHYHPMPETCKTILPEGILLADSGGQYMDGTTDITRTIALNEPTGNQKRHYTLILKGMVSLSMAKFPEGTTGGQLDTLARQFLWSEGLNYLHGTGHGVGFFLNVHESPQGFGPVHSERGKTIHQVGMLSSNEPGYYVEGEYGMRIENLIVVINSKLEGFLEFETLTLYPLDHSLIELSLLTISEINWLNQYHTLVYSGIESFLKGEIKVWFKEKCRPIE